MLFMGLVDLRVWLKAPWREFSREDVKEIFHFGLPLVLSFGLSVIISTSDRFLIDHFKGAEQVGIYSAGYTLTDRIIGIVFLMIAIPSLPLTVHRLEHEGVEAARDQTWRNGIAAFMLALPACAGLILANRQVAHAFIGEAFRDGALTVMPWIAVSGMINGLATHYFDHAFHLGKKTRLFVFTLGPAALVNVVMNLLLIPRFGILGAAWSTLVSYMLLLTLSVIVGRRAFKIRFPFKEALQITCSVALMAVVLRSIAFPENLLGLFMMMPLGGATYITGLLLFDVMDARAWTRRILRKILM
jgi:O-antigen/teichoic acid export membrane protein